MSCKNGIPYGTGPSKTDIDGLSLKPEFAYTPGKKGSLDSVSLANAKTIIEYFKNKNLSTEFGVAICGVWMAESRLKPEIFNKEEQTTGFYYKSIKNEDASTYRDGTEIRYRSGEGMRTWGYGKGLAQWTWERNLKFRDWYNDGAGGNTSSGVDSIDHNASAITATSLSTQLAFVWHEIEDGFRSEFRQIISGITESDSKDMEDETFRTNVMTCVDAITRGYENGGTRLRSKESGNWKGGEYDRNVFSKRMDWAYSVYDALKNDGYFS